MHRPAFALIPRWLCLDLNKYSGEELEFSATAQLWPFHLPWPQLFIYLRGSFFFVYFPSPRQHKVFSRNLDMLLQRRTFDEESLCLSHLHSALHISLATGRWWLSPEHCCKDVTLSHKIPTRLIHQTNYRFIRRCISTMWSVATGSPCIE